MQSEIVGALSPSVSEFKLGKTCHKFSGRRNCHKLQRNGKTNWHLFSAVECFDQDDWEKLNYYDDHHHYTIRIIIITFIIVRAALNSDKSKVICLIIPKGGITHTPSFFQQQNLIFLIFFQNQQIYKKSECLEFLESFPKVE